MWSPLSKILEAVARIRLPRMGVRQKLEVGDPRQSDYMASTRWREFLKPHALAVAWGPREGGPWWPFHCLTLFAALDYLRKDSVGPLKQDPLPVGRVRAPEWLNPRTLLFVDLRGLESVALGAALAVRGCDLVCTFNNWPHPKGVLDSQHTLAALLRYASWIAAERRRPDTPAPVAWLCDADRLGTRRGNPGDFDNRYYIEDSVLPGPNYLRERGITRIVYLGVTNRPVQPDLSEHLYQYRQQGFEVFGTRLSEAVEFSPLTDLDLTSTRFNSSGYLLASGGGFGATVPHPSSGG